jgi:hypothetical protein
MEWTQTGNVYKADLGQGYTIVKFDQLVHRWFTLQYGAEYLGTSYPSLDLAKEAAERPSTLRKRHSEVARGGRLRRKRVMFATGVINRSVKWIVAKAALIA